MLDQLFGNLGERGGGRIGNVLSFEFREGYPIRRNGPMVPKIVYASIRSIS